MKIYSIYDSKAEAYSSPFVSHNNATAIRSFTELAQQEGHPFHAHPGDYTLFHIGEWHDQKGTVTPAASHGNLGLAVHYLNPETN